MNKLRRPGDKLADCVWLARFIDKCRLHFAGALPADYQRPFCSPLGIDGIFLEHFSLRQDEILAAIRQAGNDEEVVRWFLTQASVTPESIRAWNQLAPDIGRPGFPGEKGFQWARRHLYAGCTDPRVTSGFTAIAWDEGFLDEPAPSARIPMIHVIRNTEAQKRESFGVAFDLLATGPQSMMTKMHYRTHNRIPFHSHPNEQTGYLLFGSLRVMTRDTSHVLVAGDTYCIPANVEHSIEIIADADEVQVFTPPRPEFLHPK